jgi:hypothetical protein
MSNPEASERQQEEASARLQRVTAELRELEQIIRTGNIDARVLHEFRESVDHVRTTAWAIQQWIALREEKKDPYDVLPLLTLERVKRAAQLAQDIALDLDATDVSLDTPGLEGLYVGIRSLYLRLVPLFRQPSA